MGRRSNGDGMVRHREDGRWEARLMDGILKNGRRNILYFYGKTQKEVRSKVNEYQKLQASGIDSSVKHTFETWSEFWFNHHKDRVSAATQENYSYILEALQDRIGSKRLTAVKAFDIEEVLSELQREGKSASYISTARGMLFQIFNKAEANDLILKNPVRFAEKMRSSRNGPRRKEAFRAEEVRKLMSDLPFDRMGCSIRLMLGTGMRTQELLALEPRHIETDGSVIYIRQALVRIKGSVDIGPPKSRDSYRDVPVPPSLRSCARFLRSTEKRFIWETGQREMPCNPTYFRAKFKEALEEVDGVRVLTPHCCRHTYVSQMQALGVDLSTIQSIVGHADIDMTQHYLHVQESVRQAAVDRFSEAFGGAKNS